jgi:predicted secreted protein
MAISTALAIYFVIWWVVLFTVLPWGIRSQAEDGEIVPGSDPGAPCLPRLLAKLIWTTIVSAVVFLLLAAAYHYRLFTLQQITTLFGLLD